MLRIGERQTLRAVKETGFGMYLAETEQEEERVLLPRAQVPDGLRTGGEIEVFLYRDSEDRPVATTRTPRLLLHEVGRLTVRQVGKIGAFLDWGLEKDLLLPFREQPRERRVIEGQEVLAAVYLDKSGRLCATMNVYPYLETDSPYRAGDRVTGTVYETSGNFGAFVAVDDRYSALVPKKELLRPLHAGDVLSARVTAVKPDGKLDLSLRESGPVQIERDAERLQTLLAAAGGRLPYTDKSDPAQIRAELQMSKNEFKRAAGRLLKKRQITMDEQGITAVAKERAEQGGKK